VALPTFGARRGTKLRENLRVTQKYEIHAINSDRAVGLYIFTGWATTWR